MGIVGNKYGHKRPGTGSDQQLRLHSTIFGLGFLSLCIVIWMVGDRDRSINFEDVRHWSAVHEGRDRHAVGRDRSSETRQTDAAGVEQDSMEGQVMPGESVFGEVIGSHRNAEFPEQPGHVSRLLLATHGRLMWYNYEKEKLEVIHEKEGIYYGGFPGEEMDEKGIPKTVWTVSRPHNWKPTTAREWLIERDIQNGNELNRVEVMSRFTHDVVRKGNRVYVANTGEGHVIELEFPSMKELRRLKLFTLKEHVNTLSPTDDGYMWAMLHNLGNSIVVKIDLKSGKVVKMIPNVGVMSHGVVQWQGNLLYLDSKNAALAVLDTNSGTSRVLWKSDEENKYLKGLCAVDDIAFFGMTTALDRQNRDSEDLSCDLVAFDMRNNVLLWKKKLPTKGLLNVVAAPHLHVESTAKAVNVKNRRGSYRNSMSFMHHLRRARESQGSVQDAFGKTTAPVTLMESDPLLPSDPVARYAPKIGGHWASGYPRLDNAHKNANQGFSTGVQVRLFYWEGAKEFKDFILGIPDVDWTEEQQRKTNAFLEGRSPNLKSFKPGTSAIHLIFSDQNGDSVYEFPWYSQRFARHLEPLLTKILGDDIQNIIRLQLARMDPMTEIKPHVDNGGYSAYGHRIHLVVASSPDVHFNVCHRGECIRIHTEEGLVFELHNRLQHSVQNNSKDYRIHLVVDVMEDPRKRTKLRVGQVCTYHSRIDC